MTKRLSKMEDNITDDENDSLDIETNLFLFNKKNFERTSEGKVNEVGSGGGSEEEAVIEEECNVEKVIDDISDKQYPNSREDLAGGDTNDDSNNEPDYSPLEGKCTTVKLNTNDKLQKELSTMAFEDIMSLKNKVGTKAYNKIVCGAKNKHTAEPMKRLSKHRPDEISAKKPVSFLRKVVPIKKTILRDPRFDDLSGEFRPEVFKQTYKFIDKIRQQEAQMVKKNLKKVKSDVKREELSSLLKRMENQERARQRLEQQRDKELQFKRKQRELLGQGHRPFYLKKSDKKKLELVEKYNELKKSGKLENFLSKKRKRNAIKDRRKLPYQQK